MPKAATATSQSKALTARRKATPPAIQRAKLNQQQTPKKADFLGAWLDNYPYGSTDPILKAKGGSKLAFYEGVRQDDQVKASYAQKIAIITSKETIVLPGGDRPIDIEAAEDLKRQLDNINWDNACSQMVWGDFWGFSVAEAVYKPGENQLVELAEILPRDRDRFLWTYDNEIRWRNNRDSYNGEELWPQKYWTFTVNNDSSDDPNGRGLAYWLYWPTFFKKNGMRWWILFLEKYAKPHRHGTYQPGATDEDIAALEDALEAFGEDDWTTSPEGTNISLIEASRAGGSDYQSMVDICNAAISKVINGQTMTADNGSSRSQAEVHRDIGLAIAKELSDLICQSFTNTIGKWLTEWNFPGAAIPKVWRQFDENDLKAQADTDTVLSALGIKLKASSIAEKYGDGYEIPEEEEALLQLNGEQMNALVSTVSQAKQGGWSPELVAGVLSGAFPSWPDKAIQAITKNLGNSQPQNGAIPQPLTNNGNPPNSPPIDPKKAEDLLNAAQFSAVDDPLLPIAEALLERLSVAQFGKLAEGATRSINGQQYILKNSRWHSADSGELLRNTTEKAQDDADEADKRESSAANRRERRELMADLQKNKPYSVKKIDGGHEITIAHQDLEIGDTTITQSPSKVIVRGSKVELQPGKVAGADGLPQTPPSSYEISHQPIKLVGSSQLQIHDFLHHKDRGILKKADGEFATFAAQPMSSSPVGEKLIAGIKTQLARDKTLPNGLDLFEQQLKSEPIQKAINAAVCKTGDGDNIKAVQRELCSIISAILKEANHAN